jgi:hypothetical protein
MTLLYILVLTEINENSCLCTLHQKLQDRLKEKKRAYDNGPNRRTMAITICRGDKTVTDNNWLCRGPSQRQTPMLTFIALGSHSQYYSVLFIKKQL